jgi:hypothetical protein
VGQEAPPRVYWMLHKPDEVLTSRIDGFQRTTIYDLPSLRKVPFLVAPVGRLDYRPEGLLLLTNDGELANRLCHPKYKVPRHYHVLVVDRLTEEQEKAIRKGVDLPVLLILAGVFGGLIAFGIIGLFIGPVILAVTYTLLRVWVAGTGTPAGHDLIKATEVPAAPDAGTK